MTLKGLRSVRLFSFVLLIALSGIAACTKTDSGDVRVYLKDEIRSQFPGVEITESGEHEFALIHKNGRRQLVDTRQTEEQCARLPRSCGLTISRLLVVIQESLEPAVHKISLSEVLPVIASLVPQKSMIQEGEANPMGVQVLADNIGVRFGVLSGDAMIMLDKNDVSALGASPDILLKEALANVERQAAINVTPFPGEKDVFQLIGRFPSAGLLTRKHGDKIREQLKCKELAVAFPRRGTTLLVDAENAVAVAKLREIAGRFNQPASAAISSDIYRLIDSHLSKIKE